MTYPNDPCQVPILVHQGEGYNPPPISFVDNAIPANVIPLVGYSAQLTVRNTTNSSVIALVASTSNGYIYVSQQAGQIIITIPAAVLSALVNVGGSPASFCGVYDLFIFPPVAQPMYVFGGSFEVRESVLQ